MTIYTPASLPSAGYLNPERPWVSVVVPESTVNFALNPSFERDATQWTPTGATLVRRTDGGFRGYCYGRATLTAGTAYIDFSVNVATLANHAMSVFVRYRSNVTPPTNRVSFYDKVTLQRIATTWQYWGNSWWRMIALVSNNFAVNYGILFTGSIGDYIDIDCLQIEQKSYATTYCDGDEQSPTVDEVAPYYWVAQPHASESVRSASTRSGGRIVNLAEYGFNLVDVVGLGASTIDIIAQEYAANDGALYQGARRPQRVFTLVGRFEGETDPEVSRKRGLLRAILAHDRTGTSAPTRFLLQRYESGIATGAVVVCDASYIGGLEERVGIRYGEDVQIQFVVYDALALAFDQYLGALAGVEYNGLTNNYLIRSLPRSTWQNSTSVGALAVGMHQNRIVTTNPEYYNPYIDDTQPFPGPLNGGVAYACLQMQNGATWFGGAFTNANGIANTARICVLRNGAYASIATGGATGTVYAFAESVDGSTVYAAGEITTINGVAVNYIARYTSTTGVWSALTGTTNLSAGTSIRSVAIGPDGYIYVAGQIYLSSAPATQIGLARFTGLTWEAFATAFSTTTEGYCVYTHPITGEVWCSAYFTSTAYQGVIAWKNEAARYIGQGLAKAIYYFASRNQLWMLGDRFFPSNLNYSLVQYVGTADYQVADVFLQRSATLITINSQAQLFETPNATRVISFGSYTLVYGAPITVTNVGTLPSGGTLVVSQSSGSNRRLFNLTNVQTGDSIDFSRLTVQSGVTLFVRFSAEGVITVTDANGIDYTNQLALSTDPPVIVAGTQQWSLLADNDDVSGILYHRPLLQSFDDATGL